MTWKSSLMAAAGVAAVTLGGATLSTRAVSAQQSKAPQGKAAQPSAATLLPQGIVPASPDPGYRVPRTSWGHPNIQGIWENSEEIGIPIEKPLTQGRILATQDDAFDEADKRGGATGAGPGWWYETKPFNGRTHQLIDPPDGKLPPLTDWARERREERNRNRGGEYDSYKNIGIQTRCVTRGIPGSMVPGFFMYNAGYRFLQKKDEVVIQYEMIHDVRIIPINDKRPPLSPSIRLWFGDARGHWEGDTLVVVTTNFNDDTPLLGGGNYGPGTNEQLKVTEKFTRINPKLVRYEVTMDNPKVWTRPWTIAIPLKEAPADYKIFEYACHEGNRGVLNILKGARAEEAAAAKGAKP